MLGSCEGLVEGETGSGVAFLPAGWVIDTASVVHIDLVQPLVRITESDHWQSQYEVIHNIHEYVHLCM